MLKLCIGFQKACNIVSDRGFQCLMKTGRLDYYIPHPLTVSRDTWLVFINACKQIAKILQVSQFIVSAAWNLILLTRNTRGNLVSWQMLGHPPTTSCLWQLQCTWFMGVSQSCLYLTLLRLQRCEINTYHDTDLITLFAVTQWGEPSRSICEYSNRVWHIRQGKKP